MSRGWEAVSRIGEGLLARGERKRQLDEERKYAEEQAQRDWDRDAEKRKLELEWQKERIEKERRLAEKARVGTETEKLKAAAGVSVGPDRFFGQEVVDEQGLTTFIPQRERMGVSADAELRSRDSRMRTGAYQATADTRRQDIMSERQRQEKLALQAEERKLELAKTKELNAYDIRKHRVPEEEYRQRVLSAYEQPLSAVKTQLESLSSGLMERPAPSGVPSFSSPDEAASALMAADPDAIVNLEGTSAPTVMGGNEKAKENQGKKRNPEFDAAVKAQKQENPSASEAALKAFVESALGIKEYL